MAVELGLVEARGVEEAEKAKGEVGTAGRMWLEYFEGEVKLKGEFFGGGAARGTKEGGGVGKDGNASGKSASSFCSPSVSSQKQER